MRVLLRSDFCVQPMLHSIMHAATGISQKRLFLRKLILEANKEVINSQAYSGF
jgi:hypothetical protein